LTGPLLCLRAGLSRAFWTPLDSGRADCHLSEPCLSTSIVIDLNDLDNNDESFEILSKPHELGSASIVVGIDDNDDDNDRVDATSSEPPALSSIPDQSIVIKTWS